MRVLDKLLFYKVAPRQIRYLRSIDYGAASGLARAVIDQMEADFLVGPPLTAHLPNPELMAGLWSMCRECLAAGRASRTTGDLVAGVISKMNTCPYCFDIHAAMLHSFDAPEMAGALQRGGEFADEKTQRIAQWAAATLSPSSEILAAKPFSSEEAPQIIGTAICFHYLNRMVNIFLDPIPLSGLNWMKGPMSRMSGRMMRPRLSSQQVQPGRFLNDAPDVALPAEFGWAATDANIAGGILRFVAAAEAAGRESVDARVRDCVQGRIAVWRGESPGVSRAWLEPAVAGLAETLKPAGRLSLLTALASYQVDKGIIESFRAIQPGDRDLVNTASWASYTAVRRIASWL